MKRISHKQSRRNSARRRRKVKARHARARRSRAARSRPVFGAGRVRYEIGARINAMSYGGIGVVRELVSKLGLAAEINRRLTLLKRHLPYHESDHVLNIAYNLLCGGTRLEDLGSLRNNAAYMDALGAEVIDGGGRFHALGEGDVVAALNAVRPGCGGAGAGICWPRWNGRDAGANARRQEGRHGHVLQGGVGLPPASSRWPTRAKALHRQPAGQRREPRRRGGVDRQGHRPRGAPRRAGLCVHGDTDFSLTANFRGGGLHLRDSQPGMVKRAKALEAGDWERLERRPRYTSRTGKTRSRHVKARICGSAATSTSGSTTRTCPSTGRGSAATYRMVVVRPAKTLRCWTATSSTSPRGGIGRSPAGQAATRRTSSPS